MSFVGTVKSFNPTRGYGFIDCVETQQMYGKDMFFLKARLPGGHINVGEKVSFTVLMENNGPVAHQVEILNRPAAPQAFGGSYGGAVPPMANSGAGAGAAGSFTGTVKSFSTEKGWGLIDCAATSQMYGKDVFFGRAVVPGGFIGPGAQVRFTIKLEEKGPAAASLEILVPGAAPAHNGGGFKGAGPINMMAMPPQMMGYQQPSNWMMHGMMPGMMPGMMGPMGHPLGLSGKGVGSRTPNPGQTFFGVLKTFAEDKGYGHISCDAAQRCFGKDVFLMRHALEGQTAEVGTLLSFKVQMSQKGPQAFAVAVLPPGSFGINGADGSQFTGVLKTFNDGKGWGFISSEEIQHIFGKDVFLNKRDIEAENPPPGTQVSFIIELDEGGQPVAKKAQLASGYGAAAPPSSNLRSSPY